MAESSSLTNVLHRGTATGSSCRVEPIARKSFSLQRLITIKNEGRGEEGEEYIFESWREYNVFDKLIFVVGRLSAHRASKEAEKVHHLDNNVIVAM